VLAHIVAAMALDATVAFVTPLVALLTSTPVICREEHLLNFGVLHTFPILLTLKL
jgi:hypothetical protein